MNQTDEVTQGTFLWAKQAITVAIELLDWPTEQGIELAQVNKAQG